MKTPKAKTLAITTIAVAIQIAWWVPSAEGIVRRDDVDNQDYIDFGAQFPSVGMFSTNGSISGSGVLISSNGSEQSRWVLTAAHIATPNEFTIDGTLYTVGDFIRHPDWDPNGGGPLETGVENDIALARLDTVAGGVAPSSWHDNDADLLPGLELVSVGFGRSGTGLTGGSGAAGTKRAAENTLETRGTNLPLTPPETAFEYEFHSPGSLSARALEGIAALFDSGGPVLADFGEGFVVVGIHSYVRNNDDSDHLGTYGDELGATRVPLFDDWILATVPEPKTTGLLTGIAVLAAVAVWRRRR